MVEPSVPPLQGSYSMIARGEHVQCRTSTFWSIPGRSPGGVAYPPPPPPPPAIPFPRAPFLRMPDPTDAFMTSALFYPLLAHAVFDDDGWASPKPFGDTYKSWDCGE